MSNIKVIGVDLAKNIFQIYGTDSNGNRVLSKRLRRNQLVPYIAKLPTCIIGIEASGGAHYWARKFQSCGHDVRMMAPKYVKPYNVSNKNDYNDAQAIAEAVVRPRTKFIPTKNTQQHDILMQHRIRERYIKVRTALSNQIRGLLAEYGIVLAKGLSAIRNRLMLIIEDAENELTPMARESFYELYEEFKNIDQRVALQDRKIKQIAQQNEQCLRLLDIEGIGPITATALVASVGNGHEFKNGRCMAAFIGLVPKQKSSGDKKRLLGISKRGDQYLRKLLIHGARAVLRQVAKKEDKRSEWIKAKLVRSGFNATVVAVANKTVRYAHALLTKGEHYNPACI